MLKKVLIVLSTLVVIVAVLVSFIGYKFSQSGDDYGEQRQLADPETLRKTAYGDVVGFLDISESHTWMGIPFATPPVGDLRWRAPVEPAPWQGTLDALKASDRCKQIGSVSESRPTGRARQTDRIRRLSVSEYFCTEICERESASWR